MPRRARAIVRKIEPDPIYKNRLITKLINRAMIDGKKSVVQKEVYQALQLIKEKTNDDPVKVFSQAMENIKPTMEVRPRRVGGAAYQVPIAVRGPRRESLAIRWLVASSRARSNSEFHTYAEKLAAELIDAANNEGLAVKKRLDVERMAEANRAFSHFRW
uniref:Small ribosomal subunit protein uS7 n=1 Tax=uncultured Microgenomates bacterium Rifle_16ft_4_minimus_5036 TaxID=1665119 RepID=A0A0H4TU05_9BACT|nr:30S ribosomal protein S7, small subunit ribosomal protein S7 [uncultured Microgenomates bacterium Rifle_16ft_4_minimus_5036]